MNMNFDEATADEWIGAIPKMHSASITQMRRSGLTLEQIGERWLSRTGSEKTAPFGANVVSTNYYESIRNEISKLICGHESYSKLRKDIQGLIKRHKGTAVGAIAAAIGAVLGLSAVVIVPVVGIILAIACEVGIKAWCNAQPPEQPTPKDKLKDLASN